METRMLKDAVTRRKHEGKGEEFEKRMKGMESEVKWAKTEGNKKELFGRSTVQTTPGEEGDQMLTDASRVQDKTQAALENIQAVTDATAEVGTATLEELGRQERQIKDISEEVGLIEDNLARADKLIKT